MTSTTIKKISVNDLIPYINNSRTHSDEQVLQIAASIKEFGFLNPVIVDGANGIIAGHGRVMAAKKWNGMIKASEHGQKRVHHTQKPVALAEWCIENYGKDCETILDLFGGSGFTLIASEKKDKSSFTMELSPHYCDVIINRWQTLTGKEATLESTWGNLQ